MAFASTGTLTASSASTTSFAFTVPATVLNSLVVIGIKTSVTPAALTATDNVGNVYAVAAMVNAAGFTYSQIYGVQTIPGATQITLGFGGTSVSIRVSYDTFTGNALSNAAVFDKTISASGSSASNSFTFNPTNAGELIVGTFGFSSGGAITTGSGYTASQNGGTTVASEYKLSGTTSEAVDATFASQNWGEIATAFNPAPPSNVTVVQANYLANPSTIPAPVAGNLLVVLIRQTGSLLTPTVTDNLGGSYTVNTTKSIYNSSVDTVWAAYKYAVGGETTITTTPGTGGAAAVQVVYELNGAGNPLNIEVIANRDNQAFSTLSTTAAITASANDVILAAAALSGSQLPSAWGGTPTLTNVSVGTAIALISGYATLASGITAQAFVANWTGSRVSGNLVLAISPIATSSPGIPNAVGGGSMLMMGL